MVDISFTIVFQWVNFGILLFILTKLFYRPLTDFLDKRAKEIYDNQQASREARREADSVLQAYQRKLNQIAIEGKEIKATARSEGLQERDEILKRAKEEAAKIMARTDEEIHHREKQAMERLRDATADLTIMLARKFLEKEIDEASSRKFIVGSIKEMEKI